MAGPRQPINLVIANGKKHLTKEEIRERQSSEVQPMADGIAAPSFLTAKQKKEFNRIAAQLQRLEIMGETDCDTLARYVLAQDMYTQTVKDLRAAQKARPKDMTPEGLIDWAEALDKLDKRCDRYFKQATMAAGKLGLTITDRCKLVVPKQAEAPPENKFGRFQVVGGK